MNFLALQQFAKSMHGIGTMATPIKCKCMALGMSYSISIGNGLTSGGFLAYLRRTFLCLQSFLSSYIMMVGHFLPHAAKFKASYFPIFCTRDLNVVALQVTSVGCCFFFF